MNDSLDWVVVNGNTQRIECERCGASEPMPMPMPASKMFLIGDAFAAKHKDCKEKHDG